MTIITTSFSATSPAEPCNEQGTLRYTELYTIIHKRYLFLRVKALKLSFGKSIIKIKLQDLMQQV